MADQIENQTKSNGINGHISNGGTKSPSAQINAWQAPGPAAFDFRSTSPFSSTSMFVNFQFHATNSST